MAQYVSEEFNRKCSDAGVQCTVTADVIDFKKLYLFAHLGKHPVQITLHKASYTLNPNEHLDLKSWNGEEPQVTQWFVTYNRVMA